MQRSHRTWRDVIRKLLYLQALSLNGCLQRRKSAREASLRALQRAARVRSAEADLDGSAQVLHKGQVALK